SIQPMIRSRSAGVGWGRSGGGISPALRLCKTFSHVLAALRTEASSLNLSRARPAFGLSPPWHLVQYLFSSGATCLLKVTGSASLVADFAGWGGSSARGAAWKRSTLTRVRERVGKATRRVIKAAPG